jgi:hypothetical protein
MITSVRMKNTAIQQPTVCRCQSSLSESRAQTSSSCGQHVECARDEGVGRNGRERERFSAGDGVGRNTRRIHVIKCYASHGHSCHKLHPLALNLPVVMIFRRTSER